jgi:hypothetical protein
MEITVDVNLPAFERLPYHLLDGITFREKLGTRIDVLPIQVMAGKTTTIVPNDNTIWIEHWHNLEYITIT